MEHTTVVDAKSGIIQVTERLVIKNFVEVMAGFESGRFIESEPFNLGDTPMAVRVYPNGRTEEERGNVSVFLWNKSDADINVKCQFITEVASKEFDYKKTVKAGNGFGFGDFLPHAECAEAFKDKDFIVTAKVEIPGEPVKIAGIESAAKKQKFNVWETVYKKMEETDFTLVFGDEEVPCHKIILAAASPVFKAMVENGHKEAIEGKASIEFSGDVGRALVQFIYTGDVQKDILEEHASAFLALGELYDLLVLKDMAETELLSQLEKENVVELISIGEDFRAEKIFEAALKMAKANMSWLRSQVKKQDLHLIDNTVLDWIIHKCHHARDLIDNLVHQEGEMDKLKKLSQDTLTRLL